MITNAVNAAEYKKRRCERGLNMLMTLAMGVMHSAMRHCARIGEQNRGSQGIVTGPPHRILYNRERSNVVTMVLLDDLLWGER